MQVLAAGPAVTKVWQRDREPVGPSEWKAKWIWVRGGGGDGGRRGGLANADGAGETNATILARKTFDLPAVPARATLSISADSGYRLFVNGEFVNRGPSRCHTRRQSFDVLEVAPLLHSGRNVIAVAVHHNGVPTSFHNSGRPGLLAQVDLSGPSGEQTIATDSSWRVRRAVEWESSTPRIDGRQGFVEVLDFRRASAGWTGLEFDDSKWEGAAPVLPERSSWIPQHPYFEPRAITRPWLSLVPRDLPYLTETAVRATNLIQTNEVLEFGKTGGGTPNDIAVNVSQDVHLPLETCKITGIEQYAAGKGSFQVINAPRNDDVQVRGVRSSYLVFDLGQLMYGHPLLEVEGPAGSVIDIAYATHLTGGKVVPAYMGLRLADRIILAAKPVRWEGRERKALRYISLTVRNADEPVRFRSVGLTRVQYPFNDKGSFEVEGDPELNALWHAGLDTVRAITTDAYTDNYREQKQYAGTSFYAARANSAGFGDTRLQRRYLTQVAAQQLSDGLLPPSSSVAEERETPVILEYNLLWLMGLRDYLLFSGDSVTVTELLPVAGRILQRFQEIENKAGLIENPPYPFWIDHANIDHRGESFALNAIYLTALESHAEMLRWLKLSSADDIARRVARVRTALGSGFWSQGKGLFADGRISGELSSRLSEQTNALALACGLATPEQAKSIAAKIASLEDRELVRSTPLFMYWVAEGLFRAGYGKEALVILKTRFRHMLDAGLGTLWEEWSLTASYRSGEWQPQSRSTAQAEASFPPYTFMRWLLGVEPVAPGWSETLIHVPQAGVKRVSGTVPLPDGMLTLKWTDGCLKVTVPPGPRVALALDGMAAKHVVLDGRPVAARDIADGRLALRAGTHEISVK
jgi:hypothetical protein